MYTADRARVRIRMVRRRLYVQWLTVDGAAWHDLRISFSAAFPGAGDKAFCPSTKGWSIPRYRRSILWGWLTDHFAADAIDVSEEVEQVEIDEHTEYWMEAADRSNKRMLKRIRAARGAAEE